MKPLLILKNNWKKSIFFTSVFGYAAYSLKSYVEITSHMRSLCDDLAKNYSEKRSPSKILVVVNPAANKKNAEKLFKKYAEPILHLSGYKVEMFRTENVGHAKTYIESLPELPRAIVVAGGEGTSSEVVTGLLRRNDEPCPICLLPLGDKQEKSVRNSSDFLHSKFNYVKALTSSSLSLVKGEPRYTNVIKYDVMDDESEKKLKPVYGLGAFSWGLIKDMNSLKDKYWVFGSLRNYAAVLFNSFSKKLTWELETDFHYTPPCSGCTNCFVEHKARAKPQPQSTFLTRFVSAKAHAEEAKVPKFLNDECLQIKEGHIQTSQLSIECKPNNNNFYELETRITDLIAPGFETIKNMNKIITDTVQPSLVIKSRTIELSPSLSPDVPSFYSIDGEEYDARPIKISLIQNAIKVYS